MRIDRSNFVEFMLELEKKGWELRTSHCYVRNEYIYEKYYFVQK